MSVQKMQYVFMIQVEQFQRSILGIHPEQLSDIVLQKLLTDKFALLEEENTEANKAMSLFEYRTISTYYDIVDGYVDIMYVLLAIQWMKKFTSISQYQENILKYNYTLLNQIRRLLPPELPYAHAFSLVHKANMAKAPGKKPGRTTITGYDALKPPGWKEPDWRTFFNIHLLKYTPRKTLILGDAQAGKDTYAEYLKYWYGYKFVSAFSVFGVWLRKELAKMGLVYPTYKRCYEDRVNNRALWFSLIREYNSEDETRMTKDILLASDIYCGIRSKEELIAVSEAGIFDRVIFIISEGRIPTEDKSSNTIDSAFAQKLFADKYEEIENKGSYVRFIYNIFEQEKAYEQ